MSKLTDNSPAEGAGPFKFEAPELAPGESYTVDLREVERNGKKRALARYVPFDVATVANGSNSARVEGLFNGIYDTSVFPNTTESFDRQGVAEVTVRNESSTDTIDAGDVTIEVTREPHGADDAALERKRQGPIASVVSGVTGIDLGSLGGGR